MAGRAARRDPSRCGRAAVHDSAVVAGPGRLARAGAARVLVLCGPGNNGGDGGVVARHLDAWGFPISVVWFARHEQLRGDAAVQWGILEKSGVAQSAWFDEHPGEAIDPTPLQALFVGADWLVDGLLGTGLSRPVEGPLKDVIEAINASGKPVFALDLPSGLDADTGRRSASPSAPRPPPPSSRPSSVSPPPSRTITRAKSPSSTSACPGDCSSRIWHISNMKSADGLGQSSVGRPSTRLR